MDCLLCLTFGIMIGVNVVIIPVVLICFTHEKDEPPTKDEWKLP